MNTTEISAEGLLRHATALAEQGRNLEIMDLTAILHGYLELTKLDPTNPAYRQNVEAAVVPLLAMVECSDSAGSI